MLEYRKRHMGCKFSISVDQQRPKTPTWLSQRKSMQEESAVKKEDSTVQTDEAANDADDEADEAPESPDSEVMSSPEQVEVKSLKKEHRWKP